MAESSAWRPSWPLNWRCSWPSAAGSMLGKTLTSAVRLAPDRSDYVVDRGNARFMLRDYDGAMADYEEGVRRAPMLSAALKKDPNVAKTEQGW